MKIKECCPICNDFMRPGIYQNPPCACHWAQPKSVDEAKYGEQMMAKGFAEGYHLGLREGYATAKYPEKCHCGYCRNHGELCNL